MEIKDHPCIVCAFKPTFWVGRFLGFSPLTIICAEPGQPCRFSPSRVYISIAILLAGAISATMIATLNDNSKTLNLGVTMEQSSTAKVIIAVECLNHLTSIVLLVLNTLQSRTTAMALNSIAKFLQNPGRHSQRSITVDDERALFTVAIRQIVFLLVFLFVQTSVVFFFLNKHWTHIPNPEFTILKGAVAGLCNLVCLINGFQFAIVAKLLRLMIVNVQTQLQSLIVKAQLRNPSNTTNPFINDKIRICDEIAEVRRVYGRVVKCLHKFNHSVNPQLAIITTLIMVSVVLSSFLIFQYVLTRNEEILYLQMSGRLFSNIVTALYMIQLSQALLEMREFMYNFVASLHTSMLVYHELTQLEMLMQQIDRSPPLFSASQIFPFSAGILPNMCGAVITFVLVAIQFKIEVNTLIPIDHPHHRHHVY